MSRFEEVTIKDENGNYIHSETDADGDYHLATAVIQEIISSSNNSTTANINSAATWTGTADETFGINGIQVYHFADQDCTIYIDQSLDATNWDITDSFSCIANVACTRTFTSVAPYYRARVTNNGGSATTTVRFATGMTPVINPLPRALTEMDRLKTETSLIDDNTGIKGKITPFGKTKVVNPVRTIGTAFSGTTKDTNFWTETVTGTGSVTQAGEITLATGTTANSTARYQTTASSRHVAGSANEFKFTGRLSTAAQANNIRRCGVYDDNEGFFFEVDGTTFGVTVRKGGADTQIQSGSFNGDYGPSLAMGTSMGNFVIWYWERKIYFFVNGKLLHTVTASTASNTNTLTLPIRMENINENGNTTNNSFEILVASVFRLGDYLTSPTSKYTAGATAGTVLKYGAGILHAVINNDNAGSCVIYDNTAASGTIIASIDLAKVLGSIRLDVPFSTGLTLVQVGAGAKTTITYE